MKTSFRHQRQALQRSRAGLSLLRVQTVACRATRASNARVAVLEQSRRALLSTAALLQAAQLLCPLAALSTKLRSRTWSEPCLLTVVNSTPLTVKAYWLNYDGDAELCTVLEPGSKWAVDTYASHPWRFVNADTGEVLQEFVASSSAPQVVRLDYVPAPGPTPSPSPDEDMDWLEVTPALEQEAGEEAGFQLVTSNDDNEAVMQEWGEFEGWDGIGGSEGDYSPAMVAGITVKTAGGLLRLLVSGFPAPLDLYSSKDDATHVLMAYTAETRRPLTTLTWTNTIKATGADVERVLITRVVSDTIYCRIVLTLPGGVRRSIDSRPTDGLALALQSDKPIFVAKSIGRLQLDMLSQSLPPPPDRQGSFPLPGIPPGTPRAAGPPPRPAGPKDAFPWNKSMVLEA